MVGVLVRVAVTGEGRDGLAVVAFVEGVGDAEWVDAFEQAHARVEKAWADDALLQETVRVPWGEVPGAAALVPRGGSRISDAASWNWPPTPGT